MLLVAVIQHCFSLAVAFPLAGSSIARHGTKPYSHFVSPSLVKLYSSNQNDSNFKTEAAQLLEKARKLRESLPAISAEQEKDELMVESKLESNRMRSRWTVSESEDASGVGYRLYVDIGREEGTWMDPRWGASGRRIDFTVDVKFLVDTLANKTIVDRMVKDNFGGTSSLTYELRTSPRARLRQGFDEMSCYGGGYRIDTGRNGAGTVRFYISVDGTSETGSSYGDVFVPKGCLYFSLPCFGSSIAQLSSKEGPLTVRQNGWHTGWRRQESRIVGTFRAVPIDKAQERDGF